MKKSDRIESLLASEYGPIDPDKAPKELTSHPCYLGWFEHFNAGEFYTAHDVLEHLWLKTEGENWRFFKGLIQVAGAFVHLKKQFERPEHPKDGRRIHPAARLFGLAETNLRPYAPRHLRLDVEAVCCLCAEHAEIIRRSNKNPWSPDRPVRIELTAL